MTHLNKNAYLERESERENRRVALDAVIESAPPAPTCSQVLIGKTIVEKGKSAGRIISVQQRCEYCT